MSFTTFACIRYAGNNSDDVVAFLKGVGGVDSIWFLGNSDIMIGLAASHTPGIVCVGVGDSVYIVNGTEDGPLRAWGHVERAHEQQ